METKIKKTSAEWEKESPYIILNPDGWDRKNFDYSFNQEMITKEEFVKKLSVSTIVIKHK